jgi:hypothetical protein
MKQRSEDEIISMSPMRVTLGHKEYDLHPLPIKKARIWREKLTNIMSEIVGSMGNKDISKQSMTEGLTAALIAFPDKVADLVFEWSPDLPQDTILEEATEGQMNAAFSAIMVMAYPFLAQLVTAMQVTKSQSK